MAVAFPICDDAILMSCDVEDKKAVNSAFVER